MQTVLSHAKSVLLTLLPRTSLQWLKKWHYPRMLRRLGDSDWPYAGVVRQIVRPGDVVLDIGANIGFVSVILARCVGERGRVHAFEPVPETRELLRHNVRCLGLDRVTVHPYALSDTDGTATMEIPRYDSGGENLYMSRITAREPASRGLRTVDVELRRLDEVSSSIESPVRFVKIDVEGHEATTLAGAGSFLRAQQPILLIEVSGDPDEESSAAAGMVEWLAGLGYEAYLLTDGRLSPRRAGQDAVDFFFLTDAHRRSLAERGLVTD